MTAGYDTLIVTFSDPIKVLDNMFQMRTHGERTLSKESSSQAVKPKESIPTQRAAKVLTMFLFAFLSVVQFIHVHNLL